MCWQRGLQSRPPHGVSARLLVSWGVYSSRLVGQFVWQGSPDAESTSLPKSNARERAQSTLRTAAHVARWGLVLCVALLAGSWPSQTTLAEVTQPVVAPQESITIEAARGSHWQEGEYEVWLLDGNCRIQQGSLVGRSPAAVVWILRGAPTEQWLPANALDNPFGAAAQPNSRPSGSLSKAVVYLEGDVEIRSDEAHSPQLLRDHIWLGRLQSIGDIRVNVGQTESPPAEMPSIVERGATAWHVNQDRAIQLAQFVPEAMPAFPVPQPVPAVRRLQLMSRGNSSAQSKSFPGRTADETAAVITGGVRAVVSGIQNVRGIESGTIVLEADRLVIWTNSLAGLAVGGGTSNAVDGRWEFYLEGNIIYREGNRVIYADRMYYNVTENYGTILNAEMLTPVPQYEGLLRLKADVLQQVNEQNFLAYGAALDIEPVGRSALLVPNSGTVAGRCPTAASRPRFRPAAGRSADRPGGDRSSDVGDESQQLPVCRWCTAVVLADHCHRLDGTYFLR